MRTVEIFFDYASPWSYLVAELAPKKFPGVPLVWRPIYLRGLEPFTNGLPYGPLKLSYLLHDLERVAAHEGVPISHPYAFPVDGLQALRGALVAQDKGVFDAYHRAMFRATWRERRDISSKESVLEMLSAAVRAPVDMEALTASDVKARLRDATTGAIDKGIFGVPTFAVGEELFWGLDRADYVLRAATA